MTRKLCENLERLEGMIQTELELIKTDKRKFHRSVGMHATIAKKQLNMDPDIVDAYTECIDLCYYGEGEEKTVEFVTSTLNTVKAMKKTVNMMREIIGSDEHDENVQVY